MPKLWNETIEAHRQTVSETILDTTRRLVAERGLRAVTMSQIAEETGIGRATLYKYFPDVEAILLAFHQRHVSSHLEQLTDLRNQAGTPRNRLEAVLEAFAFISQHRGAELSSELGALLHQSEYVAQVQKQLIDLLSGLLAEAAQSGEIRGDVKPEELAAYCLHALAAAGSLHSNAAVHRLVTITLSGLSTPETTPTRKSRDESVEGPTELEVSRGKDRHEASAHRHGNHGQIRQLPEAPQ